MYRYCNGFKQMAAVSLEMLGAAGGRGLQVAAEIMPSAMFLAALATGKVGVTQIAGMTLGASVALGALSKGVSITQRYVLKIEDDVENLRKTASVNDVRMLTKSFTFAAQKNAAEGALVAATAGIVGMAAGGVALTPIMGISGVAGMIMGLRGITEQSVKGAGVIAGAVLSGALLAGAVELINEGSGLAVIAGAVATAAALILPMWQLESHSINGFAATFSLVSLNRMGFSAFDPMPLLVSTALSAIAGAVVGGVVVQKLTEGNTTHCCKEKPSHEEFAWQCGKGIYLEDCHVNMQAPLTSGPSNEHAVDGGSIQCKSEEIVDPEIFKESVVNQKLPVEEVFLNIRLAPAVDKVGWIAGIGVSVGAIIGCEVIAKLGAACFAGNLLGRAFKKLCLSRS